MEKDRRLVLVVQGDSEDTVLTMWLETPCEEHGEHVLKKHLSGLPGQPNQSPQHWVLDVLHLARQELCLCDAENLPEDVVARIMAAAHA